MTINFDSLNTFFSLSSQQKQDALFQWGQVNLLPLFGKQLEKSCADLIMYFRTHSQNYMCNNIIVPEAYWRNGDKDNPTHYHLNYAFKEYIMNVVVYKECDYIYFQEDGSIYWDTDSKLSRFIYKDSESKKTHPDKKIPLSHFTLNQKNIIWSGISIGYLDVKEITPKKIVKKPKKNTVKKKDVNNENQIIETQNQDTQDTKKIVGKKNKK